MQRREIPFTPTVTADAATGRNVTRISPPGMLSTHAYFTSPSHDGPGNLIVSMDVDGKVQLCRIWNELSLLAPDRRGMLSAERLCFHGTSWASRHSHPHPRFGPGGSEVVFTSDAGGTPSAYVVDL